MTAIPVRRVLDRLDVYLNTKDYDGAERHLIHWLQEATEGNDDYGALTVLNEQIGLYRKVENSGKCMAAIDAAFELVSKGSIGSRVFLATTFINCATGYKAFSMADKALPLYEKAKEIYESELDPDDGRLGGLYNNMAVTLTGLGRFDTARELYMKALDVMSGRTDGMLESAITLLNLADLAAAQYGTEAAEGMIADYLDRAEALLNSEEPERNGYYAFVCEKCAPSFGYYGYFLTEKELKRRAGEIYERT